MKLQGVYDSSLTFDIVVNSTPESNVVAVPPEVCDDTDSGSDVDGSSKFDLTLFNDEILGATQVASWRICSNIPLNTS